jgi:hypothetical protein
MKKITCFCLVGVLLGASAFAQELKPTTPEVSDYIPLLKSAGYEAFTYDISSLKDETYTFTLEVREYVNGELVPAPPQRMVNEIENRMMISDFSEESQERIRAEGLACDPEKGIYKLYTKMSIGFAPAAADSLKQLVLSFDGAMRHGKRLTLKPVFAPGYDGRYIYDIRPFKREAFQTDGFTPLLLMGSYWYDERVKAFRFCGENEFSADLQSETLKLVPHYYVIGVVIKKVS